MDRFWRNERAYDCLQEVCVETFYISFFLISSSMTFATQSSYISNLLSKTKAEALVSTEA